MALSQAFTVEKDIWALTNTVQDVLKRQHRGFLPPASCTLVPLTPALTASNALRCTVLAVVPTMRTPEDVSWHLDIVYDCMWNLLTALWPVSAAPLFVGESRLRPRILRYTRSRAVMQHCAWSSFAFRLTQGGR